MNWVESVQSDLAVMRKLAEQGGRLTMPGGRYYVLWGFASSLGMLGHFLIATQMLPLPKWTIFLSYLITSLAGWGGTLLFSQQDEKNPESTRLMNRIVGTVWGVAGGSIGVVFLGVWLSGADPAIIGIVSCLGVGIAFAVIALLCRLTWMLAPAALWYGLVLFNLFASATQSMNGWVFLAMAGTVFVTMVGTGLKLMADERAARG